MAKEQESDRFSNFLKVQNQSWKLSDANYLGLDLVKEKSFLIDGFQIKVQFNPERMRSSVAKVDHDSIAARKCFLCPANRPSEQNSLDMGHEFLLLVNPFPIFKTHFTIPSIQHVPQLLIGQLEILMDIARQLKGFTVFYNGPECGASAPDHLHFQAGENGFLPVEAEFGRLKQSSGSCLYLSEGLQIWAFDHYLRKMISIETTDIHEGTEAVRSILNRFMEIRPNKLEPMVNLLCLYKGGKWQIHIFPRKLHRPAQFFEQGEKQLLISPASVDFGGMFITPRKEDFEKITAADIQDIFRQVTLDDDEFQLLKETIKN